MYVHTLFFPYKNVVFPAHWISSFFCRFQAVGENILELFLSYSLWHFHFRICIGVSIASDLICVQISVLCRLVKGIILYVNLKKYNCNIFRDFQHTKFSPGGVFKFSASGLSFLKYSFNFANFSPDILIKYILITKKVQTKLDCSEH